MAGLDTIVSIVSIIIVVVIAYFIYIAINSLPTTDCPKYGNMHAIGSEGGPICDSGAESYGGVCYNDVWTENGGVKTAVCTVKYPGSGDLFTNCGGEIQALSMGDDCSTLPDWTRGPGWYKTAVCTCQQGGLITADQYCVLADNQEPKNCPEGSDYFESACYTEACPSGLKRTEICTCSS